MTADDAPLIYECVVQQHQDDHYYTPGGIVKYIERNLTIDDKCQEHSLVQFQEPSTDDEKENLPPETRTRFLCANCHTAITIQSNDIELRDCRASGYPTHHFHRTGNTFECCGCQYKVELSTEAPVIPVAALQKLTEERPVYRSSVATVRGERGPTVVEALIVLLAYVRGLLQGTRRNINACNDNFKARLGLTPASKSILHAVGFIYDDENLQFICPTEGPELDNQRLLLCYGQLLALCYEIRQEVPPTGINDTYRDAVDSVWEARFAAGTSMGLNTFLEPIVTVPSNKKSVMDGYRILGTQQGAMDELVVFLYRKMIEENPKSVGVAMDCLVAVAEDRNSEALLTEVAMERSQGRLGDKEIKDAYDYFGFTEPDKVDDGLLAGVYQVKLSDEPDRQAEHKLKMSIIAEARDSKALAELVLNTGKEPLNETPVGLNNIGNTCYLNSLLQYYFTLTPFRDTILNIDNYVENEDDPDWKPKKIGGIQVDHDEVRRAKKFVYLLRNLFENLERASDRAISPEYDLAYMALLNGRVDDTSKEEPPKEGPSKVELSKEEPLEQLSATAETPLEPETREGLSKDMEDVAKTEEDPSETTEMESELETPPYKIERTASNPFEPNSVSEQLTSKVGERQHKEEAINEAIKIDLNEAPPAYEDVVMEEAPSRADEKKPMRQQDKPPALPPRDQRPSAANMMFGKQQDVTECMGNVMYLVEAALKPLETKDNGEQIKDIVRDLFYGKARQILKYEDTTTAKQVTKVQEEDFMHVIVDAAEGKDLYDGLDEYFFADRVENFHGGREATREVTVIDFPPILQIQVQRVQFDRTTVNVYKSNAFVQFDKMIYLDRYCECNFDKLADRRIQVSAWRKELNANRQTINKLTDTKAYPMPVPALLEATASILEEYQKDRDESEEDVAKYQQVLDFLRENEREARETISHCEANIYELQHKIRAQYSDLNSFGYRIHAVFIHQGQANYGHYWIYIYNHQQGQWWKFNDSRVTKVDETEIFQNTTGSTANPYFLVYIKDSEADVLVQTNSAEEPVDENPL